MEAMYMSLDTVAISRMVTIPELPQDYG